jgi:hypothetical protein
LEITGGSEETADDEDAVASIIGCLLRFALQEQVVYLGLTVRTGRFQGGRLCFGKSEDGQLVLMGDYLSGVENYVPEDLSKVGDEDSDS